MENRILGKYGLKQMARTRNLGLRKLVEKTGLDITDLSAYHIGFVIGPCLNAGGRLQTAKAALRLFLSEDEAEAEQLAEELKELNDVRKDMTKKGEDEAIAQVEERYMGDKVLVVFLPDCHESLAGIIAGRIRESYHKPVFVLTDGEEGVKGSGRSTEAYSMYDEMCKCRECFSKFGGHPMAAGLSLREDVAVFRGKINACCELTEDDFIPKIKIDMAMPAAYPTIGLIRELARLEPIWKWQQ